MEEKSYKERLLEQQRWQTLRLSEIGTALQGIQESLAYLVAEVMKEREDD